MRLSIYVLVCEDGCLNCLVSDEVDFHFWPAGRFQLSGTWSLLECSKDINFNSASFSCVTHSSSSSCWMSWVILRLCTGFGL